jgi:hypothetical protein
MKSYPSIPKEILYGTPVYVFDKLDGSNIRAEWSRKHKGFVKFGSKTVLIGEDHPILGKSISTVKNKYEKDLTDIFLKEQFQEVVCFFEYYGPSSFAGFHNTEEEQTVTLIDVNVHKKGMLYPNEFVKLFKHVEIPNLLHVGPVGPEIEELIRSGNMHGMTFEGVICKTISPIKKGYPPTMFKIKNRAWIQKVKEFCNGNAELEAQLL